MLLAIVSADTRFNYSRPSDMIESAFISKWYSQAYLLLVFRSPLFVPETTKNRHLTDDGRQNIGTQNVVSRQL